MFDSLRPAPPPSLLTPAGAIPSRRTGGLVALGLPLVAALVVAAALPQTAGASTASLSAGVLTITAGPGEANAIEVARAANAQDLTVSDSAGIAPGAGCMVESATRVFCQRLGSSPSVVASLGDGSDSFDAVEALEFIASADVDGGPGNDTITMGKNRSPNILRGGDGNDRLTGGDGDDQLFGQGGDDTAIGGRGNDAVSGGPGVDLLVGDGTFYYVDGGNDTIDSRDGERDTVNCGAGTDSVAADSSDVIDAGECESVDRAGGGGAPGGDGAQPGIGATPQPRPDGAPGVAVAAAARVKLSRLLSQAGIPFLFAVSGPCAGTVRLTVTAAEARRAKLGRGVVTLGRDSATVPEAGAYKSAVKVSVKYRRKLRSLRRLSATLRVSCSSAGKTGRDSTKITFKR